MEPTAAGALVTMRRVFFALVTGVLIFGCVVVFVLGPLFDAGDPTVFPVLALLAPVLAGAPKPPGRTFARGSPGQCRPEDRLRL